MLFTEKRRREWRGEKGNMFMRTSVSLYVLSLKRGGVALHGCILSQWTGVHTGELCSSGQSDCEWNPQKLSHGQGSELNLLCCQQWKGTWTQGQGAGCPKDSPLLVPKVLRTWKGKLPSLGTCHCPYIRKYCVSLFYFKIYFILYIDPLLLICFNRFNVICKLNS